MRIIKGSSLSPPFNQAAEEMLLESATEDIFMLWRNSASVIIGKNQNAFGEVNTDFTSAHDIKVIRRLTGGGAVFHDPGNVNFTFVTEAPEEPEIDFARFAEPVIMALGELGIEAYLSGRNDILAEGYKISGNAQCRYRRGNGTVMLLHHGTLLYDADVSALAGALRVNKEKLTSKGIASVSSRVKNIREIGELTMTAEEFEEFLLRSAEKRFGVPVTFLTESEVERTEALAQEKYSTWDWNFGRSPEFSEVREMRFPWGVLQAGLTLDRGVIRNIVFTGDFFGSEDVEGLASRLVGVRFEGLSVSAALTNTDIGTYFHGGTSEDVLRLLGLI